MKLLVALVVLSVLLYAASVVIVEVPDGDAEPVFVRDVVDGDTVRLADGRRVRLVGYDAYELSEPLGASARQELRSLCPGEAYLDVDDLEPRDRYGRVLGYLWCRRDAGNITWHISIQKYFLVGDGRKFVKRPLHIPPDEHPPAMWITRHTVRFDRAVEIYVYNDTKSPHKLHGDTLVLTSGVYEVYYGGQLVARLRLMSYTPNTTIINLPTANTTAGAAPTTAPTEAQRDLREAATVAKTGVVVVEKPVHPIIYVVIAAAVAAAAAAYLARRGRPAARR